MSKNRKLKIDNSSFYLAIHHRACHRLYYLIMLAVIKERSKAFLETIWDSWKGNADEKFGTVYGNVLYVSDLMSLKIEEELNDQCTAKTDGSVCTESVPCRLSDSDLNF
ncbi:uncharacterized protein LOC127721758 [Mytilus californianus]|uniref:uncharacterized protein LOC127721758 n=1 Tax=Mytilus californianus TaxID=6549 RepID=UPI0022485530|nr:uncharacterized protein LOC127721758 [Mytilus californianus]